MFLHSDSNGTLATVKQYFLLFVLSFGTQVTWDYVVISAVIQLDMPFRNVMLFKKLSNSGLLKK